MVSTSKPSRAKFVAQGPVICWSVGVLAKASTPKPVAGNPDVSAAPDASGSKHTELVRFPEGTPTICWTVVVDKGPET